MYKPYPYQIECLDAVQAVRDHRGTKALVVMASGLGKTVTMAFDAKRWRERQGGRVLFLCHNNDILYQAKTTFQAVNGAECSYGYFHGQEKHLQRADFLFASFQTMEKYKDLFSPDEFAYVVVDESHHSQAETYRGTIEHFRPQFLLGATATPDRLDQLDIRNIFGHEVYFLPLEEAMARDLVTPVDYRLLTDEIQLANAIETKEGRLSIAYLNRKVFVPKRDEEIAKIIAKNVSEFENPRVMIFCNSIKHCEHLAKFVPDSFAVHSQMPEREKTVRVEMFRQGIVGTVLTVNCFNEGIDIPQANVVVFLRSTVSNTVFMQQLGRGLRRSDGKDKVIVLDFVANCERIKIVHSLWQNVEKQTAHHDKQERNERSTIRPMTLNVDSVEFSETIVPLLKLMERIKPLKISEVEHLFREYSPKNLIPAEVAVAGSAEKYQWICAKCGYEWKTAGSNRMLGTGCPACAGKVVTPKNNLSVTHPELAGEYSPRNPFPADQVIAGTNKKLWWVCLKCGHEWQSTGNKRALKQTGCPACAGKIATSKINLTIIHPQLAKEYSPRNPLPADQVLAGTKKKLWWTCSKCGYEWETSGSNRTSRKSGCPACAGFVPSPTNNLSVTHPLLAKEYSSRNPLPASQILAGTKKKCWWVCLKCGYEWQAKVLNRLSIKIGCPKCKKGRSTQS